MLKDSVKEIDEALEELSNHANEIWYCGAKVATAKLLKKMAIADLATILTGIPFAIIPSIEFVHRHSACKDNQLF